MRPARLLTVAIFLPAVVGACTTASAGWTYAPAPMQDASPPSAEARPARRREPGGSGNPNLVMISALGIKFDQSDA